MKMYQVAVQWGAGARYFVSKDGYDKLSEAKADAVYHRKQTTRIHDGNKKRGAKPTVYVLKVVSDA